MRVFAIHYMQISTQAVGIQLNLYPFVSLLLKRERISPSVCALSNEGSEKYERMRRSDTFEKATGSPDG